VAGLGNSEETSAPTPPAQQAASGEAGGGAVPARAESAQPAGTSTGGIAPGAVPRVFTDDPTVATVLPAVRDRAYVLMGSWAEPTTMRRKLATWSPARATFTELGEATPALSGQPGDVPVPADYDGDGEIDMATWAPSSGTWTIRNSAGGTTEQLVLGQPGDVPVPADYDGDGRADPATWTPKTGTWHFHGAPDVAFGRQGGQPVPADYTGDGRADLAVYNKGDGIWDIQGAGRIQLGDRWNIPVPADYDGDGKVEPATFSTRTYRWFVRDRDPVRFGGPGDIPVPAQYDGDGKADFAVWHPPSRVAPTGSWEIKGVGSYPAGTAGDIPTTLG
jgi:hypothetical protein